MFSIVIRNKNEANALEKVLRILKRLYADDYSEIIVVDNNSTDNSREIAQSYGCKIVPIDRFSYGRAINYGIAAASNQYVLLLSAHAIPIGSGFFKHTQQALQQDANIAGVRFINSLDNYNRALDNDFKVTNPLSTGLMAACCIVNKKVWETLPFDEELVFAEDKKWSQDAIDKGHTILDLNETFFYFIKRDTQSGLNRYKNETLAYHQLHKVKPAGPVSVVVAFLRKILLVNTYAFFRSMRKDAAIMKIRLGVYKKLKP